jgi:hypothetical protein
MVNLSESNKRYYRYLSLVAIVILGVMSILGSGGGGDSSTSPPPPAAPSVTATSPAQSSDTALVTTEVLARFSEQMDPLTINANSFLLRDSGSRPINASSITFYAQYDGHDNVAVFVPNNDLNINEEYFATLTTEIEDTSGVALARNYVWSFLVAPAVVAVSMDSAGNFGNSGIDTLSPSASNATGEYVVFASTDSLAGRDTGGNSQIYRKNTVTGRIELVSTTSDSLTLADGPCADPRISDEGRFVIFSSRASNLDLSVTLPSTNVSHIYFKDMRDGSISLLDVSINNPNQAANGNSTRPDISGIPITDPQGRHVVFESTATDLVSGDTNTMSDIFYVNAATGGIERVSVDSAGTEATNHSYRPRVSDDGRRVVFESVATNLVTGDTNGKSDIFLRNLVTDTTTRLSVDSNGNEVNGGPDGSINADISANGLYAVFESDQHLDGDTNGSITDIFVRAIDVPSTAILSFAEGDVNGADNNSTRPSISADGRYIAFESLATDLLGAGNDTNGQADVFVRDKNSSTIERVSVDNLGAQGNDASMNAAISTDGRYVSFTTREPFDTTDFPSTYDIYRAYNSALP